jgi:hypothetical protein
MGFDMTAFIWSGPRSLEVIEPRYPGEIRFENTRKGHFAWS